MLLSDIMNKDKKVLKSIPLYEDRVSEYNIGDPTLLTESDIYLLTEEYFGRSNNLKQIDTHFDEIIKLAKRNDSKNLLKYTTQAEKDFYTDSAPILTKICKCIEDQFNFKNVGVEILNSGQNNAVTVRFSNNNYKYNVIKNNTKLTKSGLVFNEKKYSMYTAIFRTMFDIDGIEGRHLTAILLHEIGHQFYFENNVLYRSGIRFYLDQMLSIFMNPEKFMKKDIGDIIANNGISQPERMFITRNIMTKVTIPTKLIMDLILTNYSVDKFASYIKKGLNVENSNLFKYVYGAMISTKSMVNEINFIFNTLQGIASKTNLPIRLRGSKAIIDKSINISLRNHNYTEEQFCDNFATSYGYGAAFIEGISVISNAPTLIGRYVEKNIFAATLYNSYMDLDRLIFGQNGAHPDATSRIIDQIKYVETQLANNKNHPLYSQMKHELSDMKKSYNEIYKKTATISKDSDALKRGKIFSAISNASLFLTGGDLVYKANSKAYDHLGNLDAFKR